jgi:hypothetical protein
VLGDFGVLATIQATDPDGAGIRPGQSDQHIDGGRLPRSIRPEETEQLPPLDLKGYVIDRRDVAESFRQFADLNDR